MEKTSKTMRLDKWLKISRLAKTRTIAEKMCEGRKVKVNNITAKPSKMVKIGDILTINKMGKYRKYEITGISTKSVSSKIARELYRECTPEPVDPEMEKLINLFNKEGRVKRKFKGRPTKKERRRLLKIKGIIDYYKGNLI
ncbi:RNA-binding S4 domain-containing protein [candidate division KSB1 bacterium]|nr:MAG: RNA-binding S4 domain-containing protein [candidate division KSB1 bacterium]